MTNLFTFKKGLWKGITTNHPSLLSEATELKLQLLTKFLYEEVQYEFKLSYELTNDIESLFFTKVWNQSDERDTELSIDTVANLLIESIETECRSYNYPEEKIKSMIEEIKNHTYLCPEALILFESQLRCTLVYTSVVEKLIELNCPGDVAIQIIPPAQEIEHRLMLDAVNCN